jgi:hypothetical protein
MGNTTEAILAIFIGAIGFFLLLFLGWVAEVLFLGFSNVVENNYKELVLKNKDGDGESDQDDEKNTDQDDDPFTRLQKLSELRKAGIITEEEFEQKKTETLKGI